MLGVAAQAQSRGRWTSDAPHQRFTAAREGVTNDAEAHAPHRPLYSAAKIAVRRLQRAVRAHLLSRRRRPRVSTFELEQSFVGDNDWDDNIALRPQRAAVRKHCAGWRCHRWACAATALLLVLGTVWAAAVLDLYLHAAAGCTDPPCLEVISLGSLCNRTVPVRAEVRWNWRPRATVVIERVVVTVVGEASQDSEAVVVTAELLRGPTLVHGTHRFELSALLDGGEPRVLARVLGATASANGTARLRLHASASARVRSAALTGPFPVAVTLPTYHALLDCSNFSCRLVSAAAAPTAPSGVPPPPPSPGGASVQLDRLSVTSTEEAQLSVAARFTFNQSVHWPRLSLELPPIAAHLVTSVQGKSQPAHGGDVGDDGASPLQLRVAPTVADDGMWRGRATCDVVARSTAQGAHLRTLMHAALDATTGHRDPPEVYVRFSAAGATGHHLEKGDGCYLESVLGAMPPLQLPVSHLWHAHSPAHGASASNTTHGWLDAATLDILAVNATQSTGENATADGPMDEAVAAAAAAAAGSDSTAAAGKLFSVGSSLDTAGGAAEIALAVQAGATLGLPFARTYTVAGALPSLELTIESDDRPSHPVATLRSHALSLAQLPKVTSMLAMHAIPSAAGVAAALLTPHPRPNASRLSALLARLSVGVPSTHAASGLRELRFPLSWLLSLDQLPAMRYAHANSSGPPSTEPIARVSTLDVDGEADAWQHVDATIGFDLNTSSRLPRWLSMRTGRVASALMCQREHLANGGTAVELARVSVAALSLSGAASSTRAAVRIATQLARLASSQCSGLSLHSVNASVNGTHSGGGACHLALSASTLRQFARAWTKQAYPDDDGADTSDGEFAVNISVTEGGGPARHTHTGSAASLNVHARVPWQPSRRLGLALPALALTIRADHIEGPPVASAFLGALNLAHAGALQPKAALGLSTARRAALGSLGSRLIEGGSVRVCATTDHREASGADWHAHRRMVAPLVAPQGSGSGVSSADTGGGTDGGGSGGGGTDDAAGALPASIRVCTELTSESAPAGGSASTLRSLMRNASVQLVGGGAPAVHCVFPLWFCPPWTPSELRALSPTALHTAIAVPLPAAWTSVLSNYSITLALPPTRLEVGLDYHQRVVALDVPAIEIGPHADRLELAPTATIVDWYALSRWARPLVGTSDEWRANHTLSIGGSRAASDSWSRTLPAFSSAAFSASGNASDGSYFTSSSLFFQAHQPPSALPPLRLVATSATTATFHLSARVDSPLPFPVALTDPALELWFAPRKGARAVCVGRIESQSAHAELAPHAVSQLDLQLTLYAESAACIVPACSHTPSAACELCALGVLADQYSAFQATQLNARLSFSSGSPPAPLTLTSHLELFADPRGAHDDNGTTFTRRDTSFFTRLAASRREPSPMDGLFESQLDMFDTIKDSILRGVRCADLGRP